VKSAVTAWLTKTATDYLKERLLPPSDQDDSPQRESTTRAQRASA
jgi:hypothetical protein